MTEETDLVPSTLRLDPTTEEKEGADGLGLRFRERQRGRVSASIPIIAAASNKAGDGSFESLLASSAMSALSVRSTHPMTVRCAEWSAEE